MTEHTKRKSTPKLPDYMTLSQGDKILVVGTGATRNKLGYVVGITPCHYVLFFMDGQTSNVWKQNVRLLDGDNQSEKTNRENPVAGTVPSSGWHEDRARTVPSSDWHNDGPRTVSSEDWHKESLQSQLSRAIATQQVTANEIADLVRRLTGVSVESPATRKNHNRKG